MNVVNFKNSFLMTIKILICSFGVILSADITIDYKVTGMLCKQNCPSLIKKSAEKIKGVQNCDVNFDNKSALITFDDTKLNQDDLVNLITKSYNLESDSDISFEPKKSTCSKSCCSAQPSSSWYDWLFGN